MTAADRPIIAGAGATAPPGAPGHDHSPAGGPAPLGADLREVIDALRAVADLLVLHPLENPWISVSGAGIQILPGGEPGLAARAAAVESLAAALGTTARPAHHHGRSWHTATGRLGRHHIHVVGVADTQEPDR
jgi:hypothetical protein